MESVAVAGFDGFRKQYNESYGDPYLPSQDPEIDWDMLNDEIVRLFRSFRKNAQHCRDIEFLTESYFNQ